MGGRGIRSGQSRRSQKVVVVLASTPSATFAVRSGASVLCSASQQARRLPLLASKKWPIVLRTPSERSGPPSEGRTSLIAHRHSRPYHSRSPPKGRRFIKGGTSSVRQVRRRTPWSGVLQRGLRVRPSEPLPVHKTFAGTSCPGGHGIVVVGCTSLMCYRSHWGLTTPSEACTGKHTVPLGTSYLKTFAPIPPHPVPSGNG